MASWVSGSAFAKVQVGLTALFPTEFMLYQGPLPNLSLAELPERCTW